MKLKTEEVNGKTYAIVQDGKPVFLTDDGKEVAFDAPGTVATISRLNGEAKGHREAKEAAEAKLKGFEGITDAEAARKAIETVKNIKDGELVAAGKVEELKAGIKRAAEEQVAAASKAHAEAMAALTSDRDKLQGELYAEKIGGSFARSKYLADKTLMAPPHAQQVYGQYFKVEDGKTVAYDQSGNKIYSRAKPGEVAEFDEALEIIIDKDPFRNSIIKGTGPGSGARPGNGNGGNGAKTITRAEFDKLDPAAKMKAMTVDKLALAD